MSLVECPACGKDVSINAKSCPSCGEPLKNNDEASKPVEVITQQEKAAEASFTVWAFIIAWLVLFSLTYQVYIPLLEMVFGSDLKVSEVVKWLNVAVMMVPPTIIVYLFRKFIPALLAISISAGILTLVYLAIVN